MKSSSHKRDKCYFYFETSPNTKHKETKVGRHGISYPHRLKKRGGHVPRVPHLIATMGAGGLRVAKPPKIFFALLGEMCWTYLKIWAPPRQSFSPLVSQAGYGPGFNQDANRTIITE